MDNKKFLWVGLTFLLLASLFIAVQNVLATVGPDPCGSSPWVHKDGVKIIKKVYCEKNKIWDWEILKSADASSLTLSEGQTYNVNYKVDVNTTGETSYEVHGYIRVRNYTDVIAPPGYPVTITDVTDSLGPVICPVTLPHTLLPGEWFDCTYASNQLSEAPTTNVATAYYDSTSVSATATLDWSLAAMTEIDECADISDTYAGFLGEVCAGIETSFTFNYSRVIGPYEACGEYTVPNTASYVTNDTGAIDSSNWTVNVTVPCEVAEGCTPGYWKNHIDSWVGYSPGDDFETVFGVDASFDPDTLLDALNLGGGGEYALARHAVGALLNSTNPEVDYPYTTTEVIAMVQEAYSTGDFEDIKDEFESANETFCPLD